MLKKSKKTYTSQKRAGKTYYKCLICGSVGNWKNVIANGLCHKK